MSRVWLKLRDKLPAGMRASFERRWQKKDLLIALLGLLVFSMSAYAFRNPLAESWARLRAKATGAATVAVFDVRMDDNRQYAEVVFDNPLGSDHVGEVLQTPPATINPPLGGSWKWQNSNALRFEPSGGFPAASQYEVTLDPSKLLKGGLIWLGKREVTFKTDQFLVESVDVTEEPAVDGKGMVVFRGQMRFNYPVEPKTLGPLVRLEDPQAAKPTQLVLETEYRSAQIGFRTEPVQKTEKARTIKLIIPASLTPALGNVPLTDDFVREIEVGSKSDLTVRGIETEPGPQESTLKVTFSSPVSAAVAEKYLTIEPKVELKLSAEQNILSATGALEPGNKYTVKVGKGMPASDDAVLQADFSQEVELADLEPSADFQSQGLFLWKDGAHALNVETVNLDELRMTIERVYLNNLFFLFQYGGFYNSNYSYFDTLSHALGDRLKDETLDTSGAAKNKKGTTVLDLDDYVDTAQPGLYRVSLGKPDDYEAKQRWLLLTDLGAVVKKGDGELLVWVSQLHDLAAVPGAKVTLISNQNQVMATGTTDASGVWHLRDPKVFAKVTKAQEEASDDRSEGEDDANEYEGEESAEAQDVLPYMITIEKGKDFTFLRLDMMEIDTTGLDVGGAEAVGAGYNAFVYGERDLYRPGETAKGVIVVRDGGLKLPPSMPALLRHRDPQGREIETQKITTDARGIGTFQVELPAYALTGHHTLEVEVAEKVIGQYRFQVEEFVPDRISVEIVPPKEGVGPGAELKYQVASNYLFGAPAAGLPIESRVRLIDSTFSPKGYEKYSFRNAERKMDDREIFSTEGKLDDDGRIELSTAMPAGSPVPSSLDAIITARVQEQGGRGVAALTRLQVHPYPYYLGLLRIGEGYPDPGKDVDFEYVAVAPGGVGGPNGSDGKEVASKGLRADLYEDRWNTVLRRLPGGGWNYETTRSPVLRGTQTIAAGKSRGRFKFRPKDYGSYRVMLTDPESQASTEVSFYAAGWGTSPWAMQNPARLELSLDKEEYLPGETAKLQVKAPFSGKLLVTVEREGVMDTQIHDLPGNTGTLEIPVRGDYRPNAYVTATLVRKVGDLEPGSAGRAFGAVSISVNRTTNHLAPQIAAPAEMRPNKELAVTIQTAPNAVVTLAAVDEGILQLIAQKTPEPFEFFYRKLALGVHSYDTFSLLLPEVKTAPAGGGEGEAGLSQYVRTEGLRRVKPVAFWSGPIVADASGKATVSFSVPEFQGALRLMAVTIGGPSGDQFGSASKLVRVRDPIVVTPTLPRILSFGESFQIPVTVRNDTGKPGTFQASLAAQGEAQNGISLVTLGKSTQAVEVPNGREKTVYFDVKTGDRSGEVTFVASASGNGESSKATTEIGIRPDLPPVSSESVGSLPQAAFEVPNPPAGEMRPESTRRTLRVGPLPLVQFSGKLEHLLHYPYGCLEQTTSSAFPLIYLGDLIKAFDPSLLDKDKKHGDPADMVQAGIRRIAVMQLASGGFSLWPGGDTVHPWGTVYAAHFLVEARRAGHPVSDALYKHAVDWVAGDVKAKGTYGSVELARTVYGLYVLARAGQADRGTMDFIREKHARELRTESRALLAAAYAATGNPKAVTTLSASLTDVEKVERQTGNNFDSTIRNRALLLLALLDADPKSPRIPTLIDRLARDARDVQNGWWWTTQEESFTLLALGQFVQRQAKLADYAGSVYVGDKKVGSFTNKAATFDRLPPGPVKLQVEKGFTANAVFFSLMARGIPTDAAFKPASEGFEIQREFFNRDGGTLDLQNVQQGDLVVIKTRVRSTSGAIDNVAIVNLLPAGLEVENPRLSTTEQLPWITDSSYTPAYLDLRDDRILLFGDIPASSWQTYYTLVRAVAPGTFRLPPVQVEAMYNPALRATGERGTIVVKVR